MICHWLQEITLKACIALSVKIARMIPCLFWLAEPGCCCLPPLSLCGCWLCPPLCGLPELCGGVCWCLWEKMIRKLHISFVNNSNKYVYKLSLSSNATIFAKIRLMMDFPMSHSWRPLSIDSYFGDIISPIYM